MWLMADLFSCFDGKERGREWIIDNLGIKVREEEHL